MDNTDRVIFGDALGNGAGTDHSADLATVTAGMTFNTSIAGFMKRVALTANPKIKPIRVDEAGGKRWRSIMEVFDYGDKHGVAIDAIYGLEKLTFGTGAGDTDDLKDHGVVTAYVGAAADA